MITKTIRLLKGKERSISRRHPWLFSGAIAKRDKDLQDGDLVRVEDCAGRFLCSGFWQSGTIAVKILSFEDRAIDYDFIFQRVRHAVEYRSGLGFFADKDTTIFRLINGEGDFMPSLIADYYKGLIVLQFHSLGMWRFSEEITRALQETLGERCKAIFNKSSSALSRQCGVGSKDEFLFGELPDDWTAEENTLTYKVDYALGQKTGFFIDQRDNRKLLREIAKDRKVLNAFAYTGGFSLSALMGGAKEVVSLDISARAVEICEDNVKMNFPKAQNHRGEVKDVLDYMEEMPKGSYDLIVLDPPAFAKHQRNLPQALKGYRSINQKAMEKIASGGFLLTFSCSQAVSSEDFATMLFSCAAISGRNVRIIKRLAAGADHPQSIFHPEGEYLKGMLLYVE